MPQLKAFIKVSIRINQDFYPEMLHKMFIINVSWVFSTIWAVAKIWVDNDTKAKIVISKKVPTKKLLAVISSVGAN